ncbi:hypothetical protein V757_11195 [Pelistega indica]|uniref:Major capsid protein n=1 Tax=Pelistega indica TaxID=1414851 RepID=V8FVV9_9BURK|nr:hypothetical protein [Pelistega indica]ETD67547.1 hypothetical protein V757_11195 [Pelistega indica]
MAFASASGFSGLENSPLARIGYYNKIIATGWDKEFLPYITNTSIDGKLTMCNQVIQFTKQPRSGDWRPYEKNQELVADFSSPDAFVMQICNAAYKVLKFDQLDIARLCDRWAQYEEYLLKDAYETLAKLWRQWVLEAMILEASGQNKGANAGCHSNINLGAPNAPIKITSENIHRELAKIQRVLKEAGRWVDDEMFIMLPSAIMETIVDSKYASAFDMGNCGSNNCSILVTGMMPGKVMGFNVFVVDCIPQVIDASGALTYFVIAGNKEGFAFAGDLVQGDLVQPAGYFGVHYRMLAVWGGKAIYPDALAVGYWTF